MLTTLIPESRRQEILSRRTLERLTAALLVLYCVAQVVTVITRIASGADQPDAFSSMVMISANHPWYLASKIANLVAAFLLLAASALIFQVFRAHDRTLSPVDRRLAGRRGNILAALQPGGPGPGRHLRVAGSRNCGIVEQYAAVCLLRHRAGTRHSRPGGFHRRGPGTGRMERHLRFRKTSAFVAGLGPAGSPPSPCSSSGTRKPPQCTAWAVERCCCGC